MAAPEKIRALKLLIGDLEQRPPRECWSCVTLAGGLPKGVITELTGPHKTEWLLTVMKENPEVRIFWAEKNQSVLPTAFAHRGVDLARVTFGLLGEDPTISLRRILQSQLYPKIVAHSVFTEMRVLKAFQMLTEKSHGNLFLLAAKEVSTAWPISLQLSIEKREDDFDVEVLRDKTGLNK